MTRQLSTPLTDDDKAWLRSWNRLVPEELSEELSPVPGFPEPQAANVDPESGQDDDPDEGDDGESEEDEQPYAEKTVAELKELLKDRGLPVGGKHDELVSRLEQDDQSE